MKKSISTVLALVCVCALLIAGCGAPAGSGQPTSQPDQGFEAPATKIGLIVDTAGLGDKSFNDQANMGLEKAAADFNAETKVMQPKDNSQFMDMQQALAESGYGLVINNGFSMADALEQSADKYPNTSFVIIDTFVDKPNVMSVTYATHEGSYLAGIIAAMRSKTGTIAFVGGMNIPTIEKFQVGFEEGAKSVNPNINIIVKYIGNDGSAWSDPATAKALTLDAIANGADVCYHAAGGSGLGMIEACKEKGVWAIGVNLDQEAVAPDTVLTSMLTKGEVAVYESSKMFVNGEKITGHLVMDLENDGVGVVLSRHLTQEEKDAVAKAREAIIKGELKVTDIMA